MITIIAATNRPNSNTLKIAKYYQAQLKIKGQEAGIFSLEDLPADILNTDMFGKRSPAFQEIQNLISETDKFIFVMPEYNGSYPGVLKVMIDAADFPGSFYDKKAALVGLSSGKYGNIRGVDHFTGVCHYIHLNVLPLRIHIPNIKQELDENGNLFQEDTVKFTNEQIDKFINF
ncbi:NAD(P)H-dependent oxidoreductase [Pedobacter sp. MC2016-05]|jgi:NAD(P)H-dependent FMN reductase|uniref:NADPH-dependent FMN reductase n=1 Tax=unclassified Pedobacter TaxID=2628915 RepID=UPI0007030F7B|nr:MULTISPECIES: NAD(P)H-dependent oxidoreductase [unclassified Pedobacter]KQN38510.1 NADPH-dependent FMN reductase [Pedobacter sp. Leaf41]MCX2475896.1 NAD(P)H-dependent oxidoreductase [Pedobacter sp. MC2016-05]